MSFLLFDSLEEKLLSARLHPLLVYATASTGERRAAAPSVLVVIRSRHVSLLDKARTADANEEEVVVADIFHPLGRVRRYADDITGADHRRRQVAHLDPPNAADDDVALDDPSDAVPLRRHAGWNPRPCDRDLGIARIVGHLEDEALLGSEKFP